MKNLRKVLAVVLALIMIVATFAACGGNENKDNSKTALKVGFIFLHDENSTYDKNFMDAAIAACEEMGVEYAQKTQIPESNDCYDAAVELIESDGCDIIFADSFGHEAFLIKAAKEYPDVQFCHATGTQAHTAGVANFHNAFASIYEGLILQVLLQVLNSMK
jgi:basic membrane protein A